MKKLAIAIFAVVCVAMFVAPSFADDRLSLSGSMRVRAWDNTDENGVDGADSNYFDQRLRIKTKINVADDVYVVLRADYGDTGWGTGFQHLGGGLTRPRASASSTIDIDRAYLTIDKEMWSLTAGQQFFGVGVLEVLDTNATGIKFILKTPVKASIFYAKIDENGNKDDDGSEDDTDLYAVNLSYDTDAFSSNLFWGMIKDADLSEGFNTDILATDASPMMFGFNGSTSVAMVKLTTELAFAAGDYEYAGVDGDFVGTQFFLQGDMNLSDAFSMGAKLLYALGTDDANETQVTHLTDFADFSPCSDNTPMAADWSAFGFDPFDPANADAGVEGGVLYGKFNVMDALSLGGQIGYFQTEEDKFVDADVTTFNVWASYALATNTEFALAYFYADYDGDAMGVNLDLEDYKTIEARLLVNF